MVSIFSCSVIRRARRHVHVCSSEDRTMWFFGLIFLLSLDICQAAGTENSTQVYYANMTIDKNAQELILKTLKSFECLDKTKTITNVHMTTSCVKTETNKICVCNGGNKWSKQVIESSKGTCNESVCTLPVNSNQTCISTTAVKISGSITLNETQTEKYTNCLRPTTSREYTDCRDKVETALKRIYSTFNGFDTFSIIGFRAGSVIVDFEMTVVDNMSADQLLNKSKTVNISSLMVLQATGMVTVNIADPMVNYESDTTVICTTVEDLKLQPTWTLKRDGLSFDITNGTVSTVTDISATKFLIKLVKVDKHWTGAYDCSFTKTSSNVTITYKANATINMCLKPDIISSVEPAFPLCTEKTTLLFVTVSCQILQSSEPYKVTWPPDYIVNSPSNDSTTLTYSAAKLIDCSNLTNAMGNCTFTNRCNQSQSSTFNITVIGYGEDYCRQDNEWQNTKAGFKAELKCNGMAGVRTRECGSGRQWKEEVSGCLVLSLKNVLDRALISDNGLGNLDKNAAEVLKNFSGLTITENLNTRANINAAVTVYSVLNNKITTINDISAVNNFLESSNNLLNRSLNNSWIITDPNDPQAGNGSLAESYLLTFEDLIKKSYNLTSGERTNLVVKNCTVGKCDGLFNNNITLDAQVNGDIKTVAFKNLHDYLPLNDSTQTINSLVVATAADANGKMKIVIDFVLQNQRPRDTKLVCVYWDNKTHAWSEDGCEWKGPFAEGQCVCTHLSSFAILMSKTPLKVPALSTLTTAGLSVSIVSLIFFLVIEMIVWQQVVKTNTLYLRHTAHVNISVCLMVADVCFLASTKPDGPNEPNLDPVWCRIFAVLKHFCYLAMFFWMLALSTTLLHQAVFLFHKVSRTTYLRFSIFLGYICPLLIVFITFLSNDAGAENSYFSGDSCWLVYSGLLKGSIYTFILPVGIIVFFNTFSMLVVIMKLLEHHKNDDTQNDKEKAAAKTVIRSVVILTPIFGLTWAFGLLILILDLTSGPIALAVNYIFVILNAFQGLLILLTSCLGDKMTRDALLSRFKKKNVTSISSSTVKTETSWKK